MFDVIKLMLLLSMGV